MKTLLSAIRNWLGTGTAGDEDRSRLPFFVDLHSHIIPSIDDGPSTIDDTVAMLRRAYEHGTREMVATPHMFLDLFDNRDPQTVKERFGETAAELQRCGALPESRFLADMKFYPGAENFICREFLDALEARRVLTLNDSRYILIEAPPYLSVIHMRYAMDRVFASDFRPIIAHPERYLAFQERPVRVAEFLEKGCVLQINAGSILGFYGRKVRKAAWTLLREDLVNIIASDSHGATVKPHDLGTVYSTLKGKFEKAKLRLWLSINPGSIIRNGPLVEL